MKHFAFITIAATALSFPAYAIDYHRIQTDKSTLQFAYKQMGVAMDGKFRKFSSQLSFDPAKPTAAKVVLDVELGSIDTGSVESDQEVAGKPWFNTKLFPSARFTSSAVKTVGANRYEVTGKLSIKGLTQDVVVPVTFLAQGNTGVFDGAFNIRRGDFLIGEGAWAKFDIVANDIQIKFHIIADTGK